MAEHASQQGPIPEEQPAAAPALASAPARFERGRWYTLLIENKGADVVARVEGQEPLRASSPDFRVKKPGIEFRAIGPTGEEVCFDNLRVWELE